MKAIKISAALLGLAVVGWCGIAPGIVGMRYEEKMRGDFATMSDKAGGSMLSLQQFDRGWFSSTAKVHLKLPIGGQMQVLQLDYKIKQLPLPFMRWSRTDISFTPLDEQGKPGIPLPLTLQSIRNTNGSNDSHLTGHDVIVNNAAGTFTFSIEGSAHTRKGEPVSFDLTLPKFSFQAASTGSNGLAVRLNDLKLNGKLSTFNTPDVPWTSQLEQQMGEVTVLAGSTPLFQFGPSHMTIKLDDKGGNFDLSYLTHLNTLKMSLPGQQPLELDNIDMDYSYGNLNKRALIAWQADSVALASRADLRNNPAAMQQESMALLTKHMGALLAQSPSFNLQRLSMHMPKGSIQGSFSIGFDGSGVKPADITLPWLATQGQQRSTLQASLAVERTLLDALAPSAQAKAQAEMMLTQWQTQGLIKNDGKVISTKLLFDRTGVKANGQPLNLPGLMSGMNSRPAPSAPAPEAAPAMPPAAGQSSTAPAAASKTTSPAASMPPANTAPAPAAAPAAAATTLATATAPETKTGSRHTQLPGPRLDLRYCLRQHSDLAIMRCANHSR
ncbi:hypothetical protein DLM_3399 [Aquitalea magnusonii]|uniref:DUF945 domain-containing protein n=1 Tax=Aquitalea magnusonii TaxID=332411 RepID=A0A3G9GK12_9NEIS|nr:DUF945 family protein [Aquitalea magnusonii]BBF86989.1 hypothetical protein DLM_3399 [Aquitalea magnusonii]